MISETEICFVKTIKKIIRKSLRYKGYLITCRFEVGTINWNPLAFSFQIVKRSIFDVVFEIF